MKKFLVIDGNSILNRAYYGIRALSNAQGVPTNAVYGFLNILLKQLDELKPDYVSVAFDMRAKTFRHLEYEAYKANRKGMPDDLAVQLPLLKDVLSAMNIKILEKEGYEADDIIGTVSHFCDQNQTTCYILTGDRDDLQLASAYTRVLLIITKNKATQTTVYGEKEVEEEYGLTPSEFIDLKAIMGDKSDNIPGVSGIGEVGAKSLVQKYRSIEAIYAHLDDPDMKKSYREKLEKDRDMAFLSKRLATIVKDVPLELSLEQFGRREYDQKALTSQLRELGFQSILARLYPQQGETPQPTETVDYQRLDIKSEAEVLEQAKKAGRVFVVESDLDGGLAAGISVDGDALWMAEGETSRRILTTLFEDDTIEKTGNNLKETMLKLHGLGATPRGKLFDTAIGAYLLYPSRPSYGIDDNISCMFGELLPECRDISSLAAHLKALIRLRPEVERQIEASGMQTLFYDIELPLIWVLYEIQVQGFLVDQKQLAAFSEQLDRALGELTQMIYTLAGHSFNINSSKQLGVVLFEELGLPAKKKTKTGYSTDVEVLKKLQPKHEIIGYLLEYRTLSKLKSTYTDGLTAVIDPADGKIHSKFNQTVTQTGRLSSTEPNLQNIPVRTELGREIRKCFIAGPGNVLVDADYSQIELRILAHISGDETMIQAFLDGTDIHRVTASKAFHVPLEEVTPEMRSNAKAVNFGIVYGISDFGLAQDLKITKKEAKHYIDSYFEKYPQVRHYMDEVVEQAKKDGYVTTLYGRRRYLPELSSNNFMTRAFGERMALNTPIQGTAADVIKIAMVRVYRRLEAQKLRARLILQVHDELIVEAPEAEAETVRQILKEEMEGAADFRVPLLCEIHVGKSWFEAK